MFDASSIRPRLEKRAPFTLECIFPGYVGDSFDSFDHPVIGYAAMGPFTSVGIPLELKFIKILRVFTESPSHANVD